MALVRIDEKTVIQKIKTIIIGKEKPKWSTRILVLIGFVVWLFFAAYFAVIFFSIFFVDTLENPELIKDAFAKIGGDYNFNIKYAGMGWSAIDVIFYHAILIITIMIISLFGLIFIYRRKKIGYILYLIGNLGSILFTILFLGFQYVKDQISLFDITLFSTITLVFFCAMFFLKKNQVEIAEFNPEQQS